MNLLLRAMMSLINVAPLCEATNSSLIVAPLSSILAELLPDHLVTPTTEQIHSIILSDPQQGEAMLSGLARCFSPALLASPEAQSRLTRWSRALDELQALALITSPSPFTKATIKVSPETFDYLRLLTLTSPGKPAVILVGREPQRHTPLTLKLPVLQDAPTLRVVCELLGVSFSPRSTNPSVSWQLNWRPQGKGRPLQNTISDFELNPGSTPLELYDLYRQFLASVRTEDGAGLVLSTDRCEVTTPTALRTTVTTISDKNDQDRLIIVRIH